MDLGLQGKTAIVAGGSRGIGKAIAKALARDLAETDQMIERARTTGKRLLIKKYQRFSQPHRAARKLIDDGTIGRPYLAMISVIDQHLDRENDPGNWRGVWEKAGGGAVMDFGIHRIDLLQFLFGRVRSVTAMTRRQAAAFPEKAEDTGLLTLEYENGAIASIICCNCDTSLPGMTPRREIYGTEASLRIQEVGGRTKLNIRSGGNSTEVVSVSNWWEDANIAVVTHLVDCLVDGAEPVATLEEARHDLEIVLAAYRSSREGKRIGLDEA